ncbi:ribonuclease P protein subunit p29 [Parasteatoda tepidariorum]|uniref:ribonuclease P protein subunit p29 n=1 Tax=Parasteatoda tepidariorum TaxID=114398 RepID=UPI00077FBF56|nr:ribonuclease P protein subunit p29 [Parasteatoda tepidariorum]
MAGKKFEKGKNRATSSLPPSILKLSDKIGLRKVPDDYIKSFLKEILPNSSYKLDDYKQYIFSFDKFKKRNKAIQRKKRKTLLNAHEQRELAIFKLDPNATKFQNFIPINELWKQYMKNMLELKESLPSDLSNVHIKLAKADYHGCMIVVASSICPHYVGIRGIVIQETKNVFRIITPEDKVKTVPKKGSIFCFTLGENVFKIYGDNFMKLPYERMKKFKRQFVVDP